ncbi:MAG: hypothetical protein IPM55_09300 [Acidobacteria bacterium]|nr:hypothetical protein [Acidobacteriota bacterium]
MGNRLREARQKVKDDPTASLKAQALLDRVVTAGGIYPQPMLIDQFSNLSRMINQADQKIGRSAFEFYDDLMKEMNSIRGELDRISGK